MQRRLSAVALTALAIGVLVLTSASCGQTMFFDTLKVLS